ncbi:MAG: hypothetical protein HKP35_06860 [Silicimonas sp.]|nr:hypothetical protein [Silicimonas sp.]
MLRFISLLHVFPTSARKISLLTRLVAMDRTYRDRRGLGQMNLDRLSDIGVTSQDARLESSKPLWNVPQYWTR